MSDFINQLAERVEAIWFAPWGTGLAANFAEARYRQAKAIEAVAEKEPVEANAEPLLTIQRRVAGLKAIWRGCQIADGTRVSKRRAKAAEVTA